MDGFPTKLSNKSQKGTDQRGVNVVPGEAGRLLTDFKHNMERAIAMARLKRNAIGALDADPGTLPSDLHSYPPAIEEIKERRHKSLLRQRKARRI